METRFSDPASVTNLHELLTSRSVRCADPRSLRSGPEAREQNGKIQVRV